MVNEGPLSPLQAACSLAIAWVQAKGFVLLSTRFSTKAGPRALK